MALSRKNVIIIGVVLEAVIVVAVVVPVVVWKSKDSNVSDAAKKVEGCGPYSYPGVNISLLAPRIISYTKTCPLEGDCWSGEKCYACFKLGKWKVGNINNIPVCCPQCVISGLRMSERRCDCLYNG